MRFRLSIFVLSVLAASLLSPSGSNAADLACDRLLNTPAAEVLIGVHPDFAGRTFINGVSCFSETGDGKRCDWEGRIVDDRVIERRLGSQRRLIVVLDNHLSGSGAQGLVSVFACANEHVRSVFLERFLYGASIQEATPQTLVLTAGYWKVNDPTCCPSQQQRQVYRWDGRRLRYVLDGTTYTPLKK